MRFYVAKVTKIHRTAKLPICFLCQQRPSRRAPAVTAQQHRRSDILAAQTYAIVSTAAGSSRYEHIAALPPSLLSLFGPTAFRLRVAKLSQSLLSAVALCGR